MSDNASFDGDVVRQLADILKETDLTEIEVERNDWRVRVARQVTVSATVPAAASAQAVPAAAPTTELSETPQAVQDPSSHPGALKSPMVGNAYLSPAPGAAPFVRIGDKVSEGDSILIIEAMKVMNQIKASTSGTVKDIFVQDGDPVEFDQTLVIIE